jgi:hypothetical protein
MEQELEAITLSDLMQDASIIASSPADRRG